MSVRIQLRRDTAANWTATNPTLTQGEPGYETDTGKVKYGDGTTAWNSLAYAPAAAIVDGTIVNADVNASAAIAGTKISPNFGSQNVITTGTSTAASFIPTSSTAPTNGVYLSAANTLALASNSTSRLTIDANGNINADSGTFYVDATNNRVGIGTTSPTAPLAFADSTGTAGDPNKIALFSVTGTSLYGFGVSANQLDYVSGGSHVFFSRSGVTSTERFRCDSSGRLLVGTSSAYGSYPARLQVQNNDGYSALFGKYANLVSGPELELFKGRGGSASSRGIVQSGDQLGLIIFSGDDGTNGGIEGARITAHVDGTPGANTMPGRLVFSTTSSTPGASPTERMRISNAGTTTLTSAASTAPFIANIGASEVARVDSAGRLLVGTASTSNTAKLVVQGISSSSTDFGYMHLVRGGSPTAGQYIGAVDFSDLDYTTAASIAAVRDGGTWSGTSKPSRLIFSTTPDGTASSTERLRITNDGVIGYNQPAPVAVDATATLTVANLKTGIITSTTAAAVTMTLPTGTLTEGGFSGLYNNFTFEWSVINTGATNAVTVAAGTAHTLVGSGTVAAGVSGRFASRRTAANTFVTYRLS